jgi:phage gp46-like protein
MAEQQGDVLLCQTNDDGEINIVDGIVEMSGGLETAAYLSLFGGNEDDDGRSNNTATWWANLDEVDTTRHYRSETQHLLQAIPAITGNLRRIEDAAARDLAWFIEGNIASSVTVSASIPGLNKVKLNIDIEALGQESSFEFVENWKAST